MMSGRKLVLDTLLHCRLSAPKTTGIRSVSSLSTAARMRSNIGTTTCIYPETFRNVSLSSRHQVDTSLPLKRWKHSSKMGHHLETLEEMAHRPEQEAAEEKRKKKKDRKGSKKGKKGASEPEAVDDNDDDIDFSDDDLEDMEEEGEVEPSLINPSVVREKMMKSVGKFEESLKSIRGDEPTADMFDDLMVDAYGSMTPLKAVGQVVIVSPTLAQITCFDPMVAKSVCKAIQVALELNAQVEEEGNVKVPLPRISMEVREQTAKQLKKMSESCRQRIRQLRRKAMDMVKKGKDGKIPGVSKDDAFANGKELDTVTESVMETVNGIVDRKMDGIMAV